MIVRPNAFFARLGRDTKIGFGEAYMAGDWRSGPGTDLADLLTPFAARLTTLVPAPLQRLRAVVDKRIPHHQENTLEGSRSNISAHYDASNDLFAAFLDPTMSYSSAWFDEAEPLATATGLEEAQLRKIDGILDYAGVRSGTRVLEIGTGWGSLAIRAAQRGAQVTTVTISREQLSLARDRVAAAGLADRVDVRLQDYREVTGQFDAIVSVEMIEAVGEAYWPTYFATLDRLLAPGGRVALQAITMAHQRVLATRRSFGWIQKYIFPGGIIPSLQSIDDNLAAHTTLRVTAGRELGAALRAHPAPVAGPLQRALARDPRPGLRRDLPPDVGVLPGLLRGRLPQRLPRRQPAADHPAPLMELAGKVTWVVGASSGIGAAVARELVRRGATVAISARREEQLEKVSEGDMLVVPADVTEAASLRSLPRRRCATGSGRSTSWCCRPGTGSRWTWTPGTQTVFDRHLQVNLVGMSNAIAAVLPEMLRRGQRRHRRHLLGRRLSRAGRLRGLRRDQGRPDQPARVAAGARGPARASGGDHLSGVRAHRPHRRQRLPDAIHDRSRPRRRSRSATGWSANAPRSSSRCRMAALMKVARVVPVGLWAALWARSNRRKP